MPDPNQERLSDLLVIEIDFTDNFPFLPRDFGKDFHEEVNALKETSKIDFGKAVSEAAKADAIRAAEAKIDALKSERPAAAFRTITPPMKIAMMLHFATSADRFAPENQRRSDAYVTFVRELLADGMIKRPTHEQRVKNPHWSYLATPKGQAYVAALKEVKMPLPNTTWYVPK